MSGVKLRAISSTNPKIQHDLSCITSLENALATQDQTLKAVVYSEDAPHSDGDKGIMSLAVRKDTAAPLGADGDYVPLIVDVEGKLHVVDTQTAAINTTLSDLSHTEDGAHASADKGIMSLAVRKDTAAALGADGDYVPLITDNDGRLHTIDEHSASINTQIADLSKGEDAGHSSGDKGIMSLAVRKDTAGAIAGTDGDYSPLQVNSSGALRTSGASAASRNTANITNNFGGTALSGNLAQNVATASIDMNEYAHLSFVIISGIASNGKELKLEVSADNSTWFDSNNSVFIGERAVSNGAGSTSNIYVAQGNFNNLTNRYARIVSHSSGTIAFTSFSFSQLN